MKQAPERFFAAHRLLASRILGGYGIRFTVQFNLFAGSILGLGGPDQIAMLDQLQKRGDLGCFALTEVGAGVLSGFIVETTATWNQSRNGFVINTPSRSAEKNWISQGLTADWIVVFANLVLDSKNHGPHPFLFRMRDEHTGTLADGISVTDMGKKTVANDLDNAKIHFDHVFVDRTTLLNRFATILDQPVAGGGGGARRDGKDVVGVYHQVDPEQSMRIEVIGQRLMTGRLAIAEASIVCVRQLFIKTKTYADAKQVNGISGPLPLSKLPHLNKIFVDADAHFSKLEVFSASVEARLAVHLRAGSIPDPDLVEAISVAKVKNIEAATHWQHMLEQEVGSFALMGVSGFQMKDMLLCSKFAEGDSRILMQKMARDEMKRWRKRGMLALCWEMVPTPWSNPAARLKAYRAFMLGRAMQAAPSFSKGFETSWELVYELAESVCDFHVENRPDLKECARIQAAYPNLLRMTRDPLLVSRFKMD